MGEFDGLAEIVAASTRDWDDGTLDTSCVVYAAACYLSPPAIVTGEFEDLVEIAAATLRVLDRHGIFISTGQRSGRVVNGRRTCLAACIRCTAYFLFARRGRRGVLARSTSGAGSLLARAASSPTHGHRSAAGAADVNLGWCTGKLRFGRK